MKPRIQAWQLVILVVAVCGGVLWLAHLLRASRHFDGAGLVQCLPQGRATHLYVDVDALRRAGILALVAGSMTQEEPDYRRFVEQTGFDYRLDLDAAAVAFLNGNVYFALRGRFDWKQLSKYAMEQGGSCTNAVCDMLGSTPDRHISFYPLKSDVLALASSAEERGVTMIGPAQWKNPPQLPAEPVWISAPSFVFSDAKSFPAGTHSFLRPLENASRIVFAIGPQAERLQIRLDVTCADSKTAKELASDLTKATEQLKKMLTLDHQTPGPGDLASVLMAGNFQQSDLRVTGTWPLDRALVEAFAGGKIQ
jgi:hypothetical protein